LEQDLSGAASDQPDVIEPLEQVLGSAEVMNVFA
jgi:hypothetical protein